MKKFLNCSAFNKKEDSFIHKNIANFNNLVDFY